MKIKELKAFGYNVFEVTGWTDGSFRWELRDKYGYFHDSYAVYKTEEKAWEGILRWHNKNLPPEKIAQMDEMLKLKDAYWKALMAMHKLKKKKKKIGAPVKKLMPALCPVQQILEQNLTEIHLAATIAVQTGHLVSLAF